jgi:hypothetical protein
MRWRTTTRRARSARCCADCASSTASQSSSPPPPGCLTVISDDVELICLVFLSLFGSSSSSSSSTASTSRATPPTKQPQHGVDRCLASLNTSCSLFLFTSRSRTTSKTTNDTQKVAVSGRRTSVAVRRQWRLQRRLRAHRRQVAAEVR